MVFINSPTSVASNTNSRVMVSCGFNIPSYIKVSSVFDHVSEYCLKINPSGTFSLTDTLPNVSSPLFVTTIV